MRITPSFCSTFELLTRPSNANAPLLLARRRTATSPLGLPNLPARPLSLALTLPHRSLSVRFPYPICALTGCPSSESTSFEEKDSKPAKPPRTVKISPNSLYGRATRELASQLISYNTSAAFSNTLLLSQVIIGAAIPAPGSGSAALFLIAIFGAVNTIIAELIAYFKTRAQPMRARMYSDDLERVVDEIENRGVGYRTAYTCTMRSIPRVQSR